MQMDFVYCIRVNTGFNCQCLEHKCASLSRSLLGNCSGILHNLVVLLSSPGGARGKELACLCRWRKRCSLDPGSGRPLEKEMAAHSSIHAWRIPWTEEPRGLQSPGSQSRARLSMPAVQLSLGETGHHCRWIPQGTDSRHLWLVSAAGKLATCLLDCHVRSPPFLLSCGLVTLREGVQNAMVVPLLTRIRE